MRSLISAGLFAFVLIGSGHPGRAEAQTLTTQLRWEPQTTSRTMDWLLDEEETLRRSDVETGLGVGIQLNNLIVRLALAIERTELLDTDESTGRFLRKETFKRNLTFITPSIITQYYIQVLSADTLVPFAIARLGKTITFITELDECEGPDCTVYSWDRDPYYEETLFSPWQLTIGGGGDYFLNKRVSVGLETGIRFSFGSGTWDFYDENQYYEEDSSSPFDFLYGVITLNFFWI
ncbi:hypothetical protein KAI87_13545 [Myxococcota bacterium]|nr:hypothetical protein [Myxococcota bacterium]